MYAEGYNYLTEKENTIFGKEGNNKMGASEKEPALNRCLPGQGSKA